MVYLYCEQRSGFFIDYNKGDRRVRKASAFLLTPESRLFILGIYMENKCQVCKRVISKNAKHCRGHCYNEEWKKKNGDVHRKEYKYRFCPICNKRIDNRAIYCKEHYRDNSNWKENMGKTKLNNKNRLGAILPEEVKNKIRIGHLGKKLSDEHRLKIIPFLNHGKGEKSANWRGGISGDTELRCASPEWKVIRDKIFKRDHYTCQKCGVKFCDEKGLPLNVHHIIPHRIIKNHSEHNLITLCKKCHKKEEWEWEDSRISSRIAGMCDIIELKGLDRRLKSI